MGIRYKVVDGKFILDIYSCIPFYHTYMYTYMYTYMHTYIHVNIYVYIHTDIHATDRQDSIIFVALKAFWVCFSL